jgi:hypothetical protein
MTQPAASSRTIAIFVKESGTGGDVGNLLRGVQELNEIPDFGALLSRIKRPCGGPIRSRVIRF